MVDSDQWLITVFLYRSLPLLLCFYFYLIASNGMAWLYLVDEHEENWYDEIMHFCMNVGINTSNSTVSFPSSSGFQLNFVRMPRFLSLKSTSSNKLLIVQWFWLFVPLYHYFENSEGVCDITLKLWESSFSSLGTVHRYVSTYIYTPSSSQQTSKLSMVSF